MPRYIVQPRHRLHMGAGVFLGEGEVYECSAADAARMGPALRPSDAVVEQALAERNATVQRQVRLASILAAVAAGELDEAQAVQALTGGARAPAPVAPLAPVVEPASEPEPAPLAAEAGGIAPLATVAEPAKAAKAAPKAAKADPAKGA